MALHKVGTSNRRCSVVGVQRRAGPKVGAGTVAAEVQVENQVLLGNDVVHVAVGCSDIRARRAPGRRVGIGAVDIGRRQAMLPAPYLDVLLGPLGSIDAAVVLFTASERVVAFGIVLFNTTCLSAVLDGAPVGPVVPVEGVAVVGFDSARHVGLDQVTSPDRAGMVGVERDEVGIYEVPNFVDVKLAPSWPRVRIHPAVGRQSVWTHTRVRMNNQSVTH